MRLGLLGLWWCCWWQDVALAAVVPVPENVTYRVGGLAITGAEAFLNSFGPTFSTYLNQTIGEIFPGVGFVAVPLAFDDVWGAVNSGTVDFLFLNPSSASCMEREFGASTILSLRNFRQGYELNEFGGVVITAANRTDITEIAHLTDKIVEGVSIIGLGAFQLQWGLVQDAGLNLMVDPSEVRLSYGQKKIVYDVINGNADVGFVRTDMVERMDAAGEANISDINFVFVREDIAASGFPFPTSTQLVPEWPLQVLPHVSGELSKQVVLALLQLNQTDEAAVSGAYSTWDAPLSYSYLSALQVQLGVLDFEEQQCLRASNVYQAVACPEGFFKVAEDIFNSKCSDLGRETCPDGYTCLCRPCELLPETEFSFSLHVSGESVGTGECERMTICASGILAFSNLTLSLVDKWEPARESLGLNPTSTVEVHVISAGDETMCFAAGHGQFPCLESVATGGLGAPPLDVTQGWDSEMEISVGAAGSTLLRIIADGKISEAWSTIIGVEQPSCGDQVYDTRISSCNNNGSRSIFFHFADDVWKDLCGRFVTLPQNVYDLECDYVPWGSSVGVITIAASTVVTAMAVALTFWTVLHRTAQPLVVAQWIFCAAFSASVAVVTLGSVTAAGPPTDFTCAVQPVMFNLGTGAAISSLCVKMWRVLAVQRAGMKRVRIKNAMLFRYIAGLLSVDVAVLVAMCIVHLPRASVSSTTEQVSGVMVDIGHVTCDYQRSFSRSLTAYHALIACVACAISFKARSAGSQYMETQSIMAITLIIGTIGVVSLSTSCDNACQVLLSSVGTTASATIALISIFGPKVIWVHFRQASVHPAMSLPRSAPSSPTLGRTQCSTLARQESKLFSRLPSKRRPFTSQTSQSSKLLPGLSSKALPVTSPTSGSNTGLPPLRRNNLLEPLSDPE